MKKYVINLPHAVDAVQWKLFGVPPEGVVATSSVGGTIEIRGKHRSIMLGDWIIDDRGVKAVVPGSVFSTAYREAK